MDAIVYHIRLPLRPRGRNQWYKDQSERPSKTYCGADCTDHDVAARDKAPAWTDDHGQAWSACEDCKVARDVRCERCHEHLLPDRIKWLELNSHTGRYSDPDRGRQPENESQGHFPFGLDCVKKVLAASGRLEHVGASAGGRL